MLTSVSVYHVETHYIYTQPRGVIPVPHDVTNVRPIPQSFRLKCLLKVLSLANIRTFFYNQTQKRIFLQSNLFFL